MESIANFKPKKFWERPEGTTGMIFLVGIIIGGGFLLYKFLPFIITLLENALYATFLGIALVAVLWVLFDPRFRNLIFFGYKSIMRAITSFFITIDPIGIIENYVQTLKDHLKKIDKQISNVRGQIEGLKREIKSNANKMKQNLNLINAAKKSGNRKYGTNVKLAARSTGRLQNTNVTYQELLVKMETLYRTLNKIKEASEFMIADISEEVEMKKKERKMVLAGHSAIKSAMKIIKPEDDKKAMFDMTMEFMAEDVANKVGDIEHFMEISEGFINGVDLQNGAFEEEGWALLEQWEQEDSAILGNNKPLLIAQSRDPRQVLDLDNPIQKENVAVRTNQFSNLFKS
jgi:phage shock protein A